MCGANVLVTLDRSWTGNSGRAPGPGPSRPCWSSTDWTFVSPLSTVITCSGSSCVVSGLSFLSTVEDTHHLPRCSLAVLTSVVTKVENFLYFHWATAGAEGRAKRDGTKHKRLRSVR